MVHQRTECQPAPHPIIPGRFGGTCAADLRLYDPSGQWETYSVDRNGALTFIQSHTGWPPTCTQIVIGHFTGSDRTDLLLYNGVDSQLEIWTTGADGKLTLLNSHPTQETWRRILPIQLETATPTSLLFYSSTARLGRFVNVDGDGNFSVIKDHTDWRRDWTTILSGSFGGNGPADLLCYDAAAGSGHFYAMSDAGEISLRSSSDGWRSSWKHIVPLPLGDNGLTSLLFYDPAGAEGGEVP